VNRRCTGDSCLAAAGARSVSLDLPVASVLMNPRQEWDRIVAGSGRIRVARNINIDWKKYAQDKFVFAHVTAVSSVETGPDGYTVLPACIPLVNNNGNAWTNPVLLATFRTFVGGNVFEEHIQIEELSKGRILDATLRPLAFQDDKNRKANIFYCDLLTATDRKHERLVRDIESGELSTLSMGTLCDWITCSKCGKTMGDNDPNCHHIENELLQHFRTKTGEDSIVSELCGRCLWDKKAKEWKGDPKSNKFIEISWVKRPAFTGAVLNHFVGDIPK
jgi:hypothetical protein